MRHARNICVTCGAILPGNVQNLKMLAERQSREKLFSTGTAVSSLPQGNPGC